MLCHLTWGGGGVEPFLTTAKKRVILFFFLVPSTHADLEIQRPDWAFCYEWGHKVLTYTENRAVFGVFQTIDPPTPLTARRVCTPHRLWGRIHSLGGEGVGGQFFGRRQTLDWPLTV